MGSPVVHFEIAGKDGEGLESFYSRLFGWRIDRQDAGGHAYGRIESGEAGQVGGGIRHEPEGEAEVVLYVEVEDLEAAVARAGELGGGVRIPPMAAGELRFALVTDPEGNPVGMIQKK